MYKRWRVYSTFLTGFLIGLIYTLILSGLPPVTPGTEATKAFDLLDWQVLILAFSGIMGGVIYSIVVDGHVEMPRFIANKGDKFEAGLFGDILLGIAGAFILEALLPSSLTNADPEQSSSIALAATGIIGGYGGRAILRFALNRFFKLSGELPETIDSSTITFEPDVLEANIEESTTASDRTFQLITRIDDYIFTGSTEVERIVLIRALAEANAETLQQVFEALVDLREEVPAHSLTYEQGQRMLTFHEQLLAREPEEHGCLIEMALLCRDLDPPDYSKALTCLDRAITLRGPLTIGKPWHYELNRAAIRIQQASKTTRVSDFSPSVQESIIADLLAIAQVYNLETVLQAAREQQIPAPVEDWLRLNQTYLATRDDTRTVAEAVSRALGLRPVATSAEDTQSVVVGSPDEETPELYLPPMVVTPQSVDPGESITNGQKPVEAGTVPVDESDLVSTTGHEIEVETDYRVPIPNPKGKTFETIFNALGQCYDILYLDPFKISNTDKQRRVFNFYKGEAVKEQDEGIQFWIPKGTIFSSINAGGFENTSNTEILYTEADEQRALSGGLSGLAASLVGMFMPFSLSASFTNIRQERRQERSIYAFSKAEYLDFSLRLPTSSWRDLHLDPQFRKAVELLPHLDDQRSYESFIKTFGTHMSKKVEFGGLVHHQIRLNESTYASVVKRGGDFKAEAAKIFKANFSGASEASTFEEVRSHSEKLRFCGGIAKENVYDWFPTVKDDPTPVNLDLFPLHDLFTSELFPRDAFILEKRAILAKATKFYLEQKSPQPKWELWPSIVAGGSGGEAYTDIEITPNRLEANRDEFEYARISEIRVWSGACIDGIQIILEKQGSDELSFPLHGNKNDNLSTLRLDPGDYVCKMEIASGKPGARFIRDHVVLALKITTESGAELLVGNLDSGQRVSLDIPPDFQVIGFHGRCGKYVDSLGVISIPVKDLNYQLEA